MERGISCEMDAIEGNTEVARGRKKRKQPSRWFWDVRPIKEKKDFYLGEYGRGKKSKRVSRGAKKEKDFLRLGLGRV